METGTVRMLLGLVRRYRLALPAVVALGVLASLSEGLGIGLLVPLLEAILHGGTTAAEAGPVVGLVQRYAALFDEDVRLALVSGTIVGLILLKSIIVYASYALSVWINGLVGHDIRRATFRQLLRVGYLFLTQNDSGRLLNTLATETWRTTDAVGALFSLVTSACTVVVFTVLLLLISWPLTLGVAAGVTAASLLVRLVAWRTRRLGEAAVAANAVLTERMVEGLGGMRIIRAFGQEAREQSRFERASNRVRRAFLSMELVAGLVQPLLEVLYAPLFLGVLLLAWRAGVGLPTLIAFLLLLYRLQPQVKALDQHRVYLASLAGAVTAVADLLDERGKPYVRSGTVPFHGLERSIFFRDVGFRYGPGPEGPSALAEVSCEIRKGEVTAVVGASGAGKSTLVNLLCRFYDPTGGEILVDGRPLRDLDLAAWRARIGLAGQDTELLSGTILENITYGRPGASLAAVVAAARMADAHGFVTALPSGYETRVGERGLTLSGGQRQRIGLARALLRDPEVLVLDEATNALDGLSQTAILEAIARLPRPVTTIVIAHRLSTIRHADRLVVLNEGRVVEQGRPADLSGGGSHFARLYELEASGLGG